jgi:putative tryptophan/tyrosine transport system substrate-binding protein
MPISTPPLQAFDAAVSWPLAARAQQPAMPVIGFLNSQSPGGYTGSLRGFRQGLKDAGYVEGENLTVEYRWAHNELNQLPALASELVRRAFQLRENS